MRKLIQSGTIVNEGRSFIGSLIIEDDRITEIIEGNKIPRGTFEETIDATGCFVIPGIIDTHVHFREPGLTEVNMWQTLKARVEQQLSVVLPRILICQTPIHKPQQ